MPQHGSFGTRHVLVPKAPAALKASCGGDPGLPRAGEGLPDSSKASRTGRSQGRARTAPTERVWVRGLGRACVGIELERCRRDGPRGADWGCGSGRRVPGGAAGSAHRLQPRHPPPPPRGELLRTRQESPDSPDTCRSRRGSPGGFLGRAHPSRHPAEAEPATPGRTRSPPRAGARGSPQDPRHQAPHFPRCERPSRPLRRSPLPPPLSVSLGRSLALSSFSLGILGAQHGAAQRVARGSPSSPRESPGETRREPPRARSPAPHWRPGPRPLRGPEWRQHARRAWGLNAH